MSKERLYKCKIVHKIYFWDLFGRRSSLKNRKKVICDKTQNLTTNISHKSIEIAWFTSVYAIGTSIGGLITLSRSFWCIIASQTTTDNNVMALNLVNEMAELNYNFTSRNVVSLSAKPLNLRYTTEDDSLPDRFYTKTNNM